MIKINDNFWHNYLKVYDVLNNAHPYNDLLHKVIENISITDKIKVLDAGSGTGNYSITLSKLGAKVYSVDNSKVGLKMHLKKYSDANVVLHDLVKPLPFTDNFFDYIISLNTVCFLKREKREMVYKEFYRILKPGGKIISVNLLYCFKPFKIFLTHIKKDILIKGLLRAYWELIKNIIPMFKMFYYTAIIQYYSEKNDFFLANEQYQYLENRGFHDITDSCLVFGKQAIFNQASK